MENACFTPIYGLLKTGLHLCTMGDKGKGFASQGFAMCSRSGDASITPVLGTYINSLWQYTSCPLTSTVDFQPQPDTGSSRVLSCGMWWYYDIPSHAQLPGYEFNSQIVLVYHTCCGSKYLIAPWDPLWDVTILPEVKVIYYNKNQSRTLKPIFLLFMTPVFTLITTSWGRQYHFKCTKRNKFSMQFLERPGRLSWERIASCKHCTVYFT